MDSLASQLTSAIQSGELESAAAILASFLAETSAQIQRCSPAEAEYQAFTTLEVLNRALLVARAMRSQISADLQRTIRELSYAEALPENHLVGFIG